jgi:hypothetical protein
MISRSPGSAGDLRASLRAKAHAQPRFADAVDKPDATLRGARGAPFGFTAGCSARGGRTQAIPARLGHEADCDRGRVLNRRSRLRAPRDAPLQGFVALVRAAKTT